MTREELIEFAKYLDEGCNLLGEGYIESKTDEYLQNVANKNFVLADVSGEYCDCTHPTLGKSVSRCGTCDKWFKAV